MILFVLKPFKTNLRILFLLASVSGILLLSCSPSTVLLQPGYEGKSFEKANLAVVIVDDNPIVQYQGNVEPEFGEGYPPTLILEFFRRQVPIDIRNATTFDFVRVVDSVEGIEYSTRNVDVWRKAFFFSVKELIPVKVPIDNSDYVVNGKRPQFVLIIDNLEIGTEFEHHAGYVGPNGMMTGGHTSKNLNYISDFSIWDNLKRKLVSFGHIEKSASNLFPVITMNTWNSVSRSYVNGIFTDSPFCRECQ